MIPFDVEIGGKKVGITFESLVWFFFVTAGATLLGEIAYYYVQSYLPNLPKTSGTAVKKSAASTQTLGAS